MTTPVLHPRRAGRFADLLDQKALAGADSDRLHRPASGRGPRHRVAAKSDADLATLVALTQRTAAVRLTPNAQPDPGFRAELRAMLVAAVEREGIPAPAAPAKGARHRLLAGRRLLAGPGGRVRGAVVAGVAAGVLVLSGIAAASGDAMPGDALYGVKRSTERAELAFAGSDLGRGQLHLEFARTRLAEAKQVTGSQASFVRVLGDMDANTSQGVKLLTTAAVDRKDPAALDAVDTFIHAQQTAVGDILDKVSGDSRTQLLISLDLLERAATRSQQLRQALTCGIAASAGSDVLGPRPGSCSPAGNPAPPGQGTTGPGPSHTAGASATDPTAGPVRATPTAAAASTRPGSVGGTEPSARGSQAPSPTPNPTPTPGGVGGLLDGLSDLIGHLLGG